MKSQISVGDVSIRTSLEPGDLGYVIHRHGKIYNEEYGYGVSFESYVARGMHEFHANYNAERDRVWVAEHNARIIGFLLLMHRDENVAQLRYFYLEPEYRGIGLGKRMISLYMDFLRSRKYKASYLWTTHELFAAAALYRREGFQLTEEKESTAFGKKLKEQRYDLISLESN
ncbi:MAG TPA: GNAT family N-acetyltransferase [Chryseolinea sp.]